MEHVQDRMSVIQRNDQLFDILDNQCEICWNAQLEHRDQEPRNINALQEYIAKLVENAYIAGAKGLNCQSKEAMSIGNGRDQTPVEVAARIYTKDKGLRP